MEELAVGRENFLEEVRCPGLGSTSRIDLGVRESKQGRERMRAPLAPPQERR